MRAALVVAALAEMEALLRRQEALEELVEEVLAEMVEMSLSQLETHSVGVEAEAAGWDPEPP
jgi:hypothetical protein